jgi:hypothetical protein
MHLSLLAIIQRPTGPIFSEMGTSKSVTYVEGWDRFLAMEKAYHLRVLGTVDIPIYSVLP